MTTPTGNAAAASRDPHLTLRRVERQQHLVEALLRSRARRTMRQLADEVGVTPRTVARDLERLQHSGVPLDVVAGRGGGVRLAAAPRPAPVSLQPSEIAALLASLAAVGPTVSESSRSAMRKLVVALRDGDVPDA